MNITVKNIPEPLHRALKREARRRKQSLNARIIEILEADAAEAERIRKMRRHRAELDRFVASLPPLPDSTPIIRRMRQR